MYNIEHTKTDINTNSKLAFFLAKITILVLNFLCAFPQCCSLHQGDY